MRGNMRKKCNKLDILIKILTSKVFLVFLPREMQILAWPILLTLPTLNPPFRTKPLIRNQYHRSSECILFTALSSARSSWSLQCTQTLFISRNSNRSSTIDISMSSVRWTVFLSSSIVKWPIKCPNRMVRVSQILTLVNWEPFHI